jgi:hypothetical protein
MSPSENRPDQARRMVALLVDGLRVGVGELSQPAPEAPRLL